MSEQIQAAPETAAEPIVSESQESQENQEVSQETVDQLENQAENGTPKQKAEAKKMLKSLKLKVDGKELEEALPFEIPDTEEARDYMTRQLQMSKMASKRAQEYSQLEKDVRSYVELLRKDPIAALSDPSIGVDVKQLAAKVIEKEIEDSKKSPEQLKAEEYERKYKELEEKTKKAEKDAEEREAERIRETAYTSYETELIQALDKEEIPNNPYFIRRMADYMLKGLEDGFDVKPSDVIPDVKREFEEDVQFLLKKLSPEQLEKFIGKDFFNQIRKKNVSKAKAQISNPKPSPNAKAPEPSKKESSQKVDYKKFFGI